MNETRFNITTATHTKSWSLTLRCNKYTSYTPHVLMYIVTLTNKYDVTTTAQ